MILRLLSFTCLALVFAVTPAFAAKGAKKGLNGGGAKAGRVLARFDRDHNGAIDGDEVTRVQALYTAMAALDTDHNGQLSESELAAVKIPTGARAGKKAAPSSTPAPATPAPATTTPVTPAKAP